ncbi:WD40 repeat-containing protein [Heterostelium album PN500]|uniref:WD40 repeat-containing protein n=1 Tax=Heterostelium pallidum (strain ATCC 26659 / Pp 5 / PN500) TaxID=670386 RepID=D3AY65_HETP5|nr:WD40 repeat-containing protein [Heterostelium album PN500]EFA85892.1 WD40 repeat-containing protein [Heterostelium album PN500]|eukprot:XP_020437998.1 WD40 repeat-containing protein [Heterostelium album PN500]
MSESSEKKIICSLISHKLGCSPFDYTLKLKLTSECEYSSKLRCCTFQRNIHDNSYESDRLLAVGDFSGNLTVWDIDRLGLPLFQSGQQKHGGAINAIDSYQHSVATGGKDGKAILWDVRAMKMQHSFDYQPSSSTTAAAADVAQKKECAAWSIYTDDLYLFVGYESGDLSCFDLRTSKLLTTYHSSDTIKTSVSSIAINSQRDYNNIILGGSESKPLSFVKFNNNNNSNNNSIVEQSSNSDSQQPTLKSKLAWCTRYSPFSKSMFAVTTSEGSLSLYNGRDTLIDSIKLSEYPVLSVDFNGSKEGLMATVSLNRKLNILFTPFK